MKIPRNAIATVVEVLTTTGARTATKFLDEKTIVRATHQWKPSKRAVTTTIILTMGRPNHRERQFIKMCKKAGEPLPVKKIQLKFYPKGSRR